MRLDGFLEGFSQGEGQIARIAHVCYNGSNVGFGRTVTRLGGRTYTTDDVAPSRANQACAG